MNGLEELFGWYVYGEVGCRELGGSWGTDDDWSDSHVLPSPRSHERGCIRTTCRKAREKKRDRFKILMRKRLGKIKGATKADIE